MKDYLEKRREELRKRSDKGFTLMEMLIVVAIIAVLIAIAIPVFTSQLENSREATDAANLRSAYAVATAEVLTSGQATSAGPVTMTQTDKAKWNNSNLASQTIGDQPLSSAVISGAIPNALYVDVSADGEVSFSATGTNTHKVDPISGEPQATTPSADPT